MRVTVLYFATLRQRAGTRQEVVELPAEATVADLRRHLEERSQALKEALPAAVVAVNREFAQSGTRLEEGDEVALFPPVSGGDTAALPTLLRLTEDPLDLDELLQSLIRPTTGAACAFTGLVRARTERGDPHTTDHLEYEAYAPMAEAMLDRIAEEIRSRWPAIEGIAIVQRLGHLEPGTPTVAVVCTAAHRDTGVFEAARYGIDRLKEIVPVWKKEVGPGGERWVEGEHRPEEAGPGG